MSESDKEKKIVGFHQMNLDDRLLKAIAKLGWITPTLIQEKGIPLILEGKDLLAKGRTGSGKTAVFAIPIIQTILVEKQTAKEQVTRALVMAPTKELCKQIHRTFSLLTSSCSRDVSCVDVGSQEEMAAQKALLASNPDIIVTTPSKILPHFTEHRLTLKDSLQFLIIDEADLVFSFGFENEVRSIIEYLPDSYQCVLTSATLNEDVKTLKQLVLHQPVTLKLEEPELPPASQLTQYQIYAEEEDKAVLIYALFKLNLVRGKTIIFVRTVDRCYKLKLYLQQFGIPSCALNCELPVTSRCHIVQQFNAGVYDIIIASDEQTLDDPSYAAASKSSKSGKRNKDKEAGVVRGIDFQFVSNVINFDFPDNVDSYIHRVGRTARGNNKGTALSFVNVKEKELMEQVEEHLQDWIPPGQESVFKPYQFRMEEIEAFRYRARDAWRAVTRIAVREARLAEIKVEMMHCKKLKGHFENNPNDLSALRHDKALHTVRLQAHLKDVPDYIIPPTLKRLAGNKAKSANAGSSQASADKPTGPRSSRKEKSFLKRKDNPLLSFEFEGFKKKQKK